mgnify:CR=1 FL=1
MDYSDVTAFAYSSAALLSLALTLFLGVSSLQDRWKWPITGATCVQTLWLGGLSSSLFNSSISTTLLLVLEATQFIAWIVALSLTLYTLRPESWPRRLVALLIIGLLVYLLLLIDLWLNLTGSSTLLYLGYLVLSTLALVCLEQLVRNAYSGRFIKLLAISLALVFLMNIYLYSQGVINTAINPFLWQSRAALILGASFLIITAGLLFRDSIQQPGYIGLSRPVIFYSTSMVIASISIVLLALGGYYVRTMDGYWGVYIFTLLLFFSLIGLSALFLSNHVRGALQVWVSKHFFRHKYDYRQEWINVIQALSAVPGSNRVYETVYSVIARTFQANGGLVMALKGKHYHRVFSNATDQNLHPASVPAYAAFIGIMIEQDWVFAPQAIQGPMAEFNDTLPEWIRNDPNIQLIVPLITQSQLVGFVALEKNGSPTNPSWEDLDILKTIGRQLANHILIHTQEEQLSEARQLETYNKLSAFIMHDLNNLIAQLDLMVKNSERHKTNPAFIDDMILTVGNAVTRMRGLIQKFKRSDYDVVIQVSIIEAIKDSISACDRGEPKPALSIRGEDKTIFADRDRLTLALKHLIKNAQEATAENGTVEVEVHSHDTGILTISITDTGAGMTQAFIEKQLFKPFETTKTGQGMGIGAYLTRSYLEELGATLDVTSQPGLGTTFTITFAALGE